MESTEPQSESTAIIVAYTKNRIIGNKGTIPWNLPADMRHFKEMTMGCSVIMGRKTWESIPERFKPFSGRLNVILTKNPSEFFVKNAFFVNDLQKAIEICRHQNPGKIIWIIGGAEIYKIALDNDMVDLIVATEIKKNYEGDVFFPELPLNWKREVKSEQEDFDIVWYHKEKLV